MSQRHFQRTLERERDRADRNGHQFSLIIFRTETTRRPDHVLHELAEVLRRRIRSIDECGWFGRELGVVLPYTDSKGAAVVVRDVMEESTRRSLRVSSIVYTYPEDWLDDDRPSPDDQIREGPPLVGASTSSRETSGPDRPPAAVRFERHVSRDPRILPTPLWKRTADIVGASLGLLLLAPVMAAIAILIRVVSPGPILFRHKRIGRGGKLFTIIKFRTMHIGVDTQTHQNHVGRLAASNGTMAKLNTERQLIPLGGLLRSLGLDELPQLINVLRGEMSLIGPRPDVIPLDDYYQWGRRRFDVMPGITGLWQISGKNRTTFEQMVRLDVSYAQRRSIRFDSWIFARTIPVVLAELGKES